MDGLNGVIVATARCLILTLKTLCWRVMDAALLVNRFKTGTIHHEATGHYETQDQGWCETATTGYQCSGRGVWQQLDPPLVF